MSYNLKNTWSAKNWEKKVDQVVREITTDEMKRNLDRWGNMSYSKWETHIKDLRAFARRRNKAIIQDAKQYFGLSESEVKKYFGGVE